MKTVSNDSAVTGRLVQRAARDMRSAVVLALILASAAAFVSLPASAMRVGAGQFSSFLIKDDKSLWAWGDNFTGQIGDGTKVERSAPIKIPGLTSVIDVA